MYIFIPGYMLSISPSCFCLRVFVILNRFDSYFHGGKTLNIVVVVTVVVVVVVAAAAAAAAAVVVVVVVVAVALAELLLLLLLPLKSQPVVLK